MAYSTLSDIARIDAICARGAARWHVVISMNAVSYEGEDLRPAHHVVFEEFLTHDEAVAAWVASGRSGTVEVRYRAIAR